MIRSIRRDATKRHYAIACTCYKIVRHSEENGYEGVPVQLDRLQLGQYLLNLLQDTFRFYPHARLEERWGEQDGEPGLFHYVLRVGPQRWYEIHA